MARGKLKILSGSLAELNKKVCFVVKRYSTKRHSKPKSIKNFGSDSEAAKLHVINTASNNLVIVRELRTNRG